MGQIQIQAIGKLFNVTRLVVLEVKSAIHELPHYGLFYLLVHLLTGAKLPVCQQRYNYEVVTLIKL